MKGPNSAESIEAVQTIWQAAEKAFGSNAERPLQLLIGNTASAGERFFLIGILPGRSGAAFAPMESRIPLVVREEDPEIPVEACRDRLGRVSVIRGDIQEAEFSDFGEFLKGLGLDPV